MYAIIEAGGKQYKVEKDKIIDIDKIRKEKGKEIELGKVLMIKNNNKISMGNPYIKEAKVIAEVIGHIKGDKIIVFKKKRRKRYKKTIGHRKNYTRVRIKNIIATL